MIITLVIDTFDVGNNGITVSAMRFAANLISRGHTVRVVACGEPGDATGPQRDGPEMFWVPELVVPIATRLAHRQNTAFGKPDREALIAAIKDADVVHIYQPWPLGRAAERIARELGVPAIAAFHIQPENITYNIGLGWFPPAAHLVYVLLRVLFYGRFADIHCPSTFIAAQLRHHGYRARLHVISNGVSSGFRPGTGPGAGRRRAVPDPHGGPVLTGEAAGGADPGRTEITPRGEHPAALRRERPPGEAVAPDGGEAPQPGPVRLLLAGRAHRTHPQLRSLRARLRCRDRRRVLPGGVRLRTRAGHLRQPAQRDRPVRARARKPVPLRGPVIARRADRRLDRRSGGPRGRVGHLCPLRGAVRGRPERQGDRDGSTRGPATHRRHRTGTAAGRTACSRTPSTSGSSFR